MLLMGNATASAQLSRPARLKLLTGLNKALKGIAEADKHLDWALDVLADARLGQATNSRPPGGFWGLQFIDGNIDSLKAFIDGLPRPARPQLPPVPAPPQSAEGFEAVRARLRRSVQSIDSLRSELNGLRDTAEDLADLGSRASDSAQMLFRVQSVFEEMADEPRVFLLRQNFGLSSMTLYAQAVRLNGVASNITGMANRYRDDQADGMLKLGIIAEETRSVLRLERDRMQVDVERAKARRQELERRENEKAAMQQRLSRQSKEIAGHEANARKARAELLRLDGELERLAGEKRAAETNLKRARDELSAHRFKCPAGHTDISKCTDQNYKDTFQSKKERLVRASRTKEQELEEKKEEYDNTSDAIPYYKKIESDEDASAIRLKNNNVALSKNLSDFTDALARDSREFWIDMFTSKVDVLHRESLADDATLASPWT